MFIVFSAMGILCIGSNKELILKYYFKAVALFSSIGGVHNLIGYLISLPSLIFSLIAGMPVSICCNTTLQPLGYDQASLAVPSNSGSTLS